MPFLIVFAVIFVYSPTAVWALNRGALRRLWLTFVVALLLIVLFSVYLSSIFNVPHTVRLVLFVCGFGGSALLFSTAQSTYPAKR
jgi:hypothetical protein